MEWPSFQGGPTRTYLLDGDATAGARLWGQVLRTAGNEKGEAEVNTGLSRRRVVYGNNTTAMEPMLSNHAVLSSGNLYISTKQRVLALNANAGNVLWAYPKNSGTVINEGGSGNAYVENEYGQRIPEHNSCTVFGDQVVAIVPAPPGKARNNPDNPYYYGAGVNNRVVVLNKFTGEEVWSKAASEVPLKLKGILQFVGSPLVTSQGVFAMAKKTGGDTFTQLYMVRMDRQSGRVDWTCYLCSAATSAYYGMGPSGAVVPLPAMADDMVYLSTGLGADCAVDANTGRVLWLQVTEAGRNPGANSASGGGRMGLVYMGNPGMPISWAINSPLVWRDEVITAEEGSDIRRYNRFTGQLLGKMPTKSLSNATIVPGVVGDTLITVGGKIQGTNLLTGKPEWDAVALPTSESGTLKGRPFLTERYLYLPMEKALVIVDVKNGGTPRVEMWPKMQGADNKEVVVKPGNLLVTNDQVVVVNDTEVAGYARWETARDRRLEAIAKTPLDPRLYMDLGEVAFRTAHYDMAQENFQKAVDLAVGQNQGGGDDKLVERLYRMNLLFAELLLTRSEAGERDRARFYFEQCHRTARSPETNAEWRLLKAPLALVQKRPAEAATLYNEVLTDPELRTATFKHGESVLRAGIAAESRFRELIAAQGLETLNGGGEKKPGEAPSEDLGAEKAEPWTALQIDVAGRAAVYQPFENQAQAMLVKLRETPGGGGEGGAVGGGYQGIIAAYPNSQAALAASEALAGLAQGEADRSRQIAALRWSYARQADPKTQARLAGELCRAYTALKRYALASSWLERGIRQEPGLTWVEVAGGGGGKSWSFAELREQIAQQAPELSKSRLPVVGLPQLKPGEKAPAPGAILGASNTAVLLPPLEGNRYLQRPDLVAVYDLSREKISFVDMPSLKVRSTCSLPNSNPTALLLGYVGNKAILATVTGAVAVDVESGAISWEIKIALPAAERAKQAQMLNQLSSIQFSAGAIMAADIDLDENAMINQQAMMRGNRQMGLLDLERIRSRQFMTIPDMANYTTMRIIGGRLVVLSGRELKAYDLGTGKLSWMPVTMPEDTVASVVVGNEEILGAQAENVTTGASTFVFVNASTGRNQRTLKLDRDRVYWRSLSDDGTLYCAGDTAVGAYEVGNDKVQARWNRKDVRTLMPSACSLTIDGLVLIDSNSDLTCLAQDTGEAAWPRARRVNLTGANGMALQPGAMVPPGMQPGMDGGNYGVALTTIDGDNVNVLSGAEVAAYRTKDGAEAWQSAMRDLPDKPPLVVAQITDPYLVVFASGTTRNTQRSVNFYFINRVNPKNGELSNGKLEAGPQIRTRADGSAEGPVIRHWQAVDGGIAMEINGKVWLYRPVKLSEKK